jgi:hypothetical protein
LVGRSGGRTSPASPGVPGARGESEAAFRIFEAGHSHRAATRLRVVLTGIGARFSVDVPSGRSISTSPSRIAFSRRRRAHRSTVSRKSERTASAGPRGRRTFPSRTSLRKSCTMSSVSRGSQPRWRWAASTSWGPWMRKRGASQRSSRKPLPQTSVGGVAGWEHGGVVGSGHGVGLLLGSGWVGCVAAEGARGRASPGPGYAERHVGESDGAFGASEAAARRRLSGFASPSLV